LYGLNFLTDLSLDEGSYKIENVDGLAYTNKWITVSKYEKEVFGKMEEVVYHRTTDGEINKNYEFISGIGQISYSACYMYECHQILLGAVIDNVEYGDTTSW
jgi:hypothetical protein